LFCYEFTRLRKDQVVDFVIRANKTRIVIINSNGTTSQLKLKDISENIPNSNTFQSIQVIPRSRERDQKEVVMNISFTPVTIKGKKLFTPSKKDRIAKGESVYIKTQYHNDLELNLVIVENKEEKLEWLLFTTKKVLNMSDALSILNTYKKRWIIERFHYTLKSGFKIEEMIYNNHQALQKMISIYSITAVKVLRLTLASRIDPDRDCSIFVEDEDWKPLYITIKKTKNLPKTPPTILEFTMMLARLGGFLNWQEKNPPGVVVLWRGNQRLEQIKKIYPDLCNRGRECKL
jgi:Transposase Tn5 dimerisation domain